MQEAQTFAIHLTARHKPLLNMGSLRPLWGSPNIKSLLIVTGGDCEVIEQYVFAFLSDCGDKITKKFRIIVRRRKKVWENVRNIKEKCVSS